MFPDIGIYDNGLKISERGLLARVEIRETGLVSRLARGSRRDDTGAGLWTPGDYLVVE